VNRTIYIKHKRYFHQRLQFAVILVSSDTRFMKLETRTAKYTFLPRSKIKLSDSCRF